MEALDAERARIGREIRMGPAQVLATVWAKSAISSASWSATRRPRSPASSRCAAVLRPGLANIRELVSELRPPSPSTSEGSRMP